MVQASRYIGIADTRYVLGARPSYLSRNRKLPPPLPLPLPLGRHYPPIADNDKCLIAGIRTPLPGSQRGRLLTLGKARAESCSLIADCLYAGDIYGRRLPGAIANDQVTNARRAFATLAILARRSLESSRDWCSMKLRCGTSPPFISASR